MFSFSKSDKVLVVAPHPDDESLGAGGLLQRIFAQKIPVRILFATNGENNPWAQRFWESRWQIGPNERVRWGQRRRQETLNAISTLGGKPDCARFLNLPDLGTTNLLMQGDPELSVLITDNIQEWEPTVALIPTMHDAHPDHSALSVAFSMALDSVGGSSDPGLGISGAQAASSDTPRAGDTPFKHRRSRAKKESHSVPSNSGGSESKALYQLRND
jgi:LmbE family N-acetylglucosaminyl deacetylase